MVRAHALPPAFVLGLGENGYGVLRSLARAGVEVTGFYSEAKECGRFSRHVRARLLSPSLEDERICDVLIDHARRSRCQPVLVPTSDRFAFLLAQHQARLHEHFLYHWVAPDTLAAAADKDRVALLCQRAGVDVPLTHATSAGEDLIALYAALPYPCLVKPNRSFDAPFPYGMKNFLANRPGELAEFYTAYPHLLGHTVCQQVIEGGDDHIFQCTVLMRLRGAPVMFCTRKLHQYPPGYGVMCYGRSEDHALLREQSLKLLQALDYRGLASLEFKQCRRDGRLYFIELNPRLPWYNALFTAAGVNLPHLACVDLAGNSIATLPRQRDGVHWLGLKLDAGWYWRMRGHGASLLEWLRGLLRARCFAWLDWRDMRPFLHATVQLLQLAVQRLRQPLDEKPAWRRLIRSRPSS
jgi:predicted ATP-grasp superfamily ATP-dependent carboligase